MFSSKNNLRKCYSWHFEQKSSLIASWRNSNMMQISFIWLSIILGILFDITMDFEGCFYAYYLLINCKNLQNKNFSLFMKNLVCNLQAQYTVSLILIIEYFIVKQLTSISPGSSADVEYFVLYILSFETPKLTVMLLQNLIHLTLYKLLYGKIKLQVTKNSY